MESSPKFSQFEDELQYLSDSLADLALYLAGNTLFASPESTSMLQSLSDFPLPGTNPSRLTFRVLKSL
jgi:hypothetical protein